MPSLSQNQRSRSVANTHAITFVGSFVAASALTPTASAASRTEPVAYPAQPVQTQPHRTGSRRFSWTPPNALHRSSEAPNVTLRAIVPSWAPSLLAILLAFACGLACSLPATSASATTDTLTLVTGETLTGRIEQDAGRGLVAIHLHERGVTYTRRFPLDQVADIDIPERTGTAFAVLPVFGTIGATLEDGPCTTSDAFLQALEHATRLGAEEIILVVDSPGGLLAEMYEILNVIQRFDELRFTAYLRNAHSAAVVIAHGCDRIIVAPGAALGAATPLKLGPDGTPANIEAKYQSAYFADLRNLAKRNGHDPWLLLGMADASAVLHVQHEDDPARRTITRLRSADEAPDAGRVLKHAGDILTLTDTEALRLGVAEAAAVSVNDIPALLGYEPGTWRTVGPEPWHRLINAARAERTELVRAFEAQVRDAVRRARAEELRPVLFQLYADLEQAVVQINTLDAELAAFEAEVRQAIRTIDSERRRRRISSATHAQEKAAYEAQLADLQAQAAAKRAALEQKVQRLTQSIQDAERLIQQ